MRTTVDRLILDAVGTGKNTTASNGRWKCRVNKDTDQYIVTHHTTDMFIYCGPRHRSAGMVFPFSLGYGSQSDKQGITSMLRAVDLVHGADFTSYNELYSGKPTESSRIQGPVIEPSEMCTGYLDSEGHWHHDGDTCPVHEVTKPDPDLEPFTPPLTVEDTIV